MDVRTENISEGPLTQLVRGLVLQDLGLANYEAVYQQQKDLLKKRKEGEISHDQLLFVEHPEVYTYGRKIKQPPPGVVHSVSIERGGEVTYHNPGQLVVYPIVKLEDGERDLHRYLRQLEQVLIDVLAEFQVCAEARPGATGVWLIGRQKKIASIGVAVSGWVTYHGIALNVHNDLSGFFRIHPCGYSAEVMTSLYEVKGAHTPSLSEVKESFLKHFCRILNRRLVN